MRVGVTGTREGPTEAQQAALYRLLSADLAPVTELHTGDCIGVDEAADVIAAELGIHRIGHPPVSGRLRAFRPFDETRDPAGYRQRDRDIVDETEVLIAAPDTASERPGSGTWYTVNYARERGGRTVIIVLPDGTEVLDRLAAISGGLPDIAGAYRDAAAGLAGASLQEPLVTRMDYF